MRDAFEKTLCMDNLLVAQKVLRYLAKDETNAEFDNTAINHVMKLLDEKIREVNK